MSRKLKVGVVGAGVFGGYHAQKCQDHPRAEYIGTYDICAASARRAASKRGGTGYARYSSLLKDCEAIIIASPASQHGTMALQALNAGCHTLIEKPIATTRRAAEACIEAAASKPLVLQIGHQERFVAKAIGLDRIPEIPTRIEARRFSPYSSRGTDVSVTLDLMTHDIDMALWLMKGRPAHVSGNSVAVRSETPDAAIAHFSFDGGGRVRLTASRVEQASERVMTLHYPSGTVSIDFNAKTMVQTAGFDLDSNFAAHPMAKDSLAAAMDSFVSAALDGSAVEITGLHGLHALDLALKIDEHSP